ncbi:MAG: PD-(D/E)XK nuclease family protein [Bacteroidales bacterium]|nr:PD-(D/E)XK nuclease family protein [Bacteroidales bacterium]
MEEFLKTVARHYKQKSCHEAQLRGEPISLPLSRYLFCFPNRRSGLFFARHLQDAFNEGNTGNNKVTCCVPPITTISELFGLFSTRHVIDRTALLFHLYGIYNGLTQRRERETFDQFVFWGDMLLSDFDDVDKYLVDARKLFANVRDLKEIDAKFAGFTEEQIHVIRSFWQSFNPGRDYPEGEKHEVFRQTWAILTELYHAFREKLESQNLAYGGMMEREVVERLLKYEKVGSATAEDNTKADIFSDLNYDKVVFVGLTAVSEVERRLMALLKLHGKAEFCWDYADPRLQPEISKATSAAYFTKQNLSDFGNEISEEELRGGLVPEKERQVSLYSVSSGVGQTRLASQILHQWKQTVPDFDPFRTAVVLPDENLLLPMLYAVPADLGTFNVTMGYSLKSTPVAAFVTMLAALQQSWRENERSFYFRQVLPLLSHSFTLGVSGKAARRFTQEITRQNLYQVPMDLFQEDAFLSLIFKPIHSADEAIGYVDTILDLLMKKAAQDIEIQKEAALDEQGQYELSLDDAIDVPIADSMIFTDTDYEFLYHYRKTLLQLDREIKQHSIGFTFETLFLLLEKLVAGVSVPFTGEPLSGLQLMGVLETRALDFDNVIILSMNEGVFPANSVQNTFIPMSLRDAFGMPTQKHRDSVFAYHFYRLIGRAHRLALIYDSRTEGMQTGEESRYVKQLRFLMGHDDLIAHTVSDNIRVVSPPTFEVRKTDEIINLLNRCLDTGDRNFSASVLKDYIICPLKFYLRFVRQLNEDDEVSEGVDAAHFGDILHEAIRSIYSGCEGKVVQASMIDNILGTNRRVVHDAIRKAFDEVMNLKGKELEGYNLLVSQILSNYVIETLRHDKELCPFVYLAGECKQLFTFRISDERAVRIKCIYDRLDRPMSSETIRIVDYKTGNSQHGMKLVFPSVEDFFREDGKGSKEAFQVMLYCLMLENADDNDLKLFHLLEKPTHVVPHLYFVRDFQPRGKTSTVLKVKQDKNLLELEEFAPYRDEFVQRLTSLFDEIYNRDIPFTQCKDTKPCEWCAFANLCKRI